MQRSSRIGSPWLSVGKRSGVLVLTAARSGKTTTLILYNTLARTATVTLKGQLVAKRSVKAADMLGRIQHACRGGKLTIAPLTYARVVIS